MTDRKKIRVLTAKGRKTSSTKWLSRHLNDPYVRLAKLQGYRSRAAFKLVEIEERFRLLRDCKIIIDLGAAPGGWTQVAKKYAPNAQIIAIDLKPIQPIADVSLIEADIVDCDALLEPLIGEKKADLILSDMAPSTSGDRMTDHLGIINCIEEAIEFSENFLKEKGNFVVKLFMGAEEGELVKDLRKRFGEVKYFKPKASNKESAEIYLICLGFSRKYIGSVA